MQKSVNILVFTRYSELGASSRLRINQYLPYFENNNLSCKVFPFFNEKYLKDLYANKRVNIVNIIYLYIKRLLLLLTVKKYDLIWIEKEVFPYMPSMIESIITLFHVKYIVDYDDAIFHNYDRFNSYLFRNKFNIFLQKSSLVVVCNEYLLNYVTKCGAKNILQVPTVVDMDKYYQKQYSIINKEFRIGWIGSPSTTKYLYILKDVLEKISKKYTIKLVVIGGSELENFNVPIEFHKWSENSENALLKTFDVGIMPLFETKWEEGKCGYKLIQYMASGLPVIASSFGFNKKIVDKKIGFLANNDNEWELALEYFIKNRNQVQIYGKNARKKAENYYSLLGWSEVMLEQIQSLVNGKK
jgi:glycosyltransferase involved in cell wall biosynthesis